MNAASVSRILGVCCAVSHTVSAQSVTEKHQEHLGPAVAVICHFGSVFFSCGRTENGTLSELAYKEDTNNPVLKLPG